MNSLMGLTTRKERNLNSFREKNEDMLASGGGGRGGSLLCESGCALQNGVGLDKTKQFKYRIWNENINPHIFPCLWCRPT